MSSESHSIQVSGLSKRYEIYNSPSDRLRQMIMPRIRRIARLGARTYFDEFWALRNVSFDVRRGETVGIVGRNGSGKSTLLQMICGTLTPTIGNVTVHGRIAALLELGAGFNPEFSGEENVRLSGLLYGLTEDELAERYEAIVKFADIGSFIDQPVKSYSSGMYVRLAFAVAINVSPDILIVDEALSVGDEAFQRKCFARIDRIRNEGATVLFVSHAAGIVTQLCDRAILLDAGELLVQGSPKFVLSRYHKMLFAPLDRVADIRASIVAEANHADSAQMDGRPDADHADDAGAQMSEGASGLPAADKSPADSRGWYDVGMQPKSTVRYETYGVSISEPHLETPGGRRVNVLHAGDDYIYVYQVQFDSVKSGVRCGMLIKTVTGLALGGGATSLAHKAIEMVQEGTTLEVRFRFRCLLDEGVYFLNAGVLARIGEEETYVDRLIDAAMFRVLPQPERLATNFVDFCVSGSVNMAADKAQVRA